MNNSSFFKRLTIRLELITYVLVVPFVSIFIIFVNSFTLLETGYFLLGAIIGVLVTLIIFPALRYFHLTNIFPDLRKFKGENLSQAKILAKSRLLNFPLLETVYVNIEWALGVPVAGIVSSHFLTFNLLTYSSYFVSFVMIFFINGVSHYFTSEILIGKELSKEAWTQVPTKNVKVISIRARILFSILSVVWLCFFMFGYMIVVENSGLNHLQNILYYLPILGFQLIIVIALITYLFSYSTTKNTEDLIRHLLHLSNGQLGEQAPMISTDEIGVVKSSLNQFNIKLSDIVKEIHSESDRLYECSKILLNRSIETADKLMEQASSAEEMSAATQNLHEGAEKLLSKTNDQVKQLISANESLKSLKLKIGEIGSKSKEAGTHSKKMETLANLGSEKIRLNLVQMENIREITLKIQGISSLVGEIADKVGLLSLNASIEAARAGEAGRGFAVVAQEISKLGESTQKNAKEINNLVNQAVKVVNLGSDAMKDLKESLESILSGIGESIQNIHDIQFISEAQGEISDVVEGNSFSILDFTKEILRENQEQTHVLKEISSAVDVVATNTNFLVTSSEENQSFANDLQGQAFKLRQTLSFFQSL